MKRILAVSLAAVLFLAAPLSTAQHRGGGRGGPSGGEAARPAPDSGEQPKNPSEEKTKDGFGLERIDRRDWDSPRSVIHLERPWTGRLEYRVPGAAQAVNPSSQAVRIAPRMGIREGELPPAGSRGRNAGKAALLPPENRPGFRKNAGMGAANAVHHHPQYSAAEIRQTLADAGVKTVPNPIADRSRLLDTDRGHSSIAFPRKGADGRGIKSLAVSPKRFNDPAVRGQMGLVDAAAWRDRAARMNREETRVGRYYWHRDNGFDYCHYYDRWGYHWYGWYLGPVFFWTRFFGGYWWWFDTDLARWCFWDDGWWWWQDPYHVGDLYFYDDGRYVACNSPNDQVMAAIQKGDEKAYLSPDGSRMVKVLTDGDDAFLFDTAIPPSVDPIYLASKVSSVKFSDTSHGAPLEIMLTLADGTVDVFDSSGNPLKFEDAVNPK